MAGFCATYLFFSYVSATIIYFILGIFASTDNVVLLVEHYRLNSTNQLEEDERNKVKMRTLLQYYLAYGLSLILSIFIYFFCIRKKTEEKKPISKTLSFDLKNQPYQPIILNQPEEEIKTNNDLDNENNNLQSINTIRGMGENEI